jgi:hypothetical protein
LVRGDLEPTPGAGPCLEDLFKEINGDDLAELFSTLVNKEHNYVEVLLGKDEKRRLEVYARCFVSLRCLEVIEVVAELCGRDVSLEPFEWPEVDKAEVLNECLRLSSRPEPPLKVHRFLMQLGLGEPQEVLGYRVVEEGEFEA